MIKWHAGSWHAVYKAGGREFRLDVEPSDIPGSTAWYWKVTNEEGKVVRSGSRKSPGQAKTSCTRAAKARPGSNR
jgi:hypothetical protein